MQPLWIEIAHAGDVHFPRTTQVNPVFLQTGIDVHRVGKHTVFRIVRHKTETLGMVVTVVHGVEIIGHIVTRPSRDRCIEIARIENDEHVLNQIINIYQVFAQRIEAAVGVLALQGQVGRIGGKTGHTLVPQFGPGIHVAIGGLVEVRPTIRIDLDDVVILFFTAKIGFGVTGLGPLICLVKSPVHTVQVKVVIAATLVRLTHLALQITAVNIGDVVIVLAAVLAPGIVLFTTKVDAVEGGRTFRTKQGIFKLFRPVFFPEVKAKRPFWTAFFLGTGGPPDAQTSIDLKLLYAIFIDQFDGTRTFPSASALLGIDINTSGHTEQIGHIGGQRDGGQLFKGLLHQGSVGGTVGHIGCHGVIQQLIIDTRAWPRIAGMNLRLDFIQKYVGMSHRERWLVAGLNKTGSDHITWGCPPTDGQRGVDGNID